MVDPPDPAHAAADPPPRRNLVLDLFFGRHSALERGPLRVLRLVALGMVFENYDIGLINSALPQIAAGLGMEADETGFYTGAIRLGGLGALFLIPFADRAGRRRMFLLSLFGMSVGTCATGFSQTPLQFVALQIMTRAFMLTGATLAVVILVEEFPADQRGSAIGMLGVLGGVGYGLGVGLYAAIEALPYGWRALYALGAAPLALLPFFRRALRETHRFERHAAERLGDERGLRAWAKPLVELVRTHPRRAAVVGLAGLFGSMGSIAVFQYTSYFVQVEHGWAPGEYSLLVVGGGLIGLFGNVVGGRGSDRSGRRLIGFCGLAFAPLFAVLFFNGPAAFLVVCWGLYIFCMAAGDVVVRALAAELFPTSHRGTAGGLMIAVQAFGFSGGLFVVGLATESFADLARVVSWVSGASVLAGVCVLFLPETHRRELEAISGEPVFPDERGAPPPASG